MAYRRGKWQPSVWAEVSPHPETLGQVPLCRENCTNIYVVPGRKDPNPFLFMLLCISQSPLPFPSSLGFPAVSLSPQALGEGESVSPCLPSSALSAARGGWAAGAPAGRPGTLRGDLMRILLPKEPH